MISIRTLVWLFLIGIIGIFLYVNNGTNICDKQLTDNEYITHMITHHEVAVYMSENHLHTTKNPVMLNILRNLIRLQKYEISIMKDSKISNNNISSNNISNKNNKPYIYTQGDYVKPNTPDLSNTFCDHGFFNISHNKNIHSMTDAMYIQHMIPHHQVAIDMSKQIIKTTNNNFIIDLAYKIIRDQQSESIILYNISKSGYSFESNIV